MKPQHTIVFLLVLASSATFAQTSFGVSPGIVGFSGAKIGFRGESKVMPYFSLQFLGYNYNYEDTDPDFGFTEETKFTLYVPTAGVRIYMRDEETLKSFINVGLSKPFLIGKREIDGEEDPTYKDELKETKLFAMEASFGAEYFFNEHFSLSGEYGVWYLHYKQESVEFNYIEKLNLTPTFSRITFNYYF